MRTEGVAHVCDRAVQGDRKGGHVLAPVSDNAAARQGQECCVVHGVFAGIVHHACKQQRGIAENHFEFILLICNIYIHPDLKNSGFSGVGSSHFVGHSNYPGSACPQVSQVVH